MTEPTTEEVDVLIIGSGPVGSLFAHELVEKAKKEAGPKKKILMVDAGAQTTGKYGDHQKNSFLYQRNVDEFVNVIKGHLHPLSVSTRSDVPTTLDPSSFHYDAEKYAGFVLNNQNPHQHEKDNLGASVATYAVGGMSTHWTCAVPEFNEELERSWTPEVSTAPETYPINKNDLKKGYAKSAELLKLNKNAFSDSARHQLVKKVLNREAGFPVENLPLAVTRREDTNEEGRKEFVEWSSAGTVLGAELSDPAKVADHAHFKLRAEHQATRIVLKGGTATAPAEVDHVVVRNLRDFGAKDRPTEYHIKPKALIVACGAVLTAQLLYASRIDEHLNLPVGKYMTEQPMAFCQIVLKQEYLDELERHLGEVTEKDDKPHAQAARDRVKAYRAEQKKIISENQASHRKRPADPIPFPKDEPEPNLVIRASTDRPWHCQIHRDAFSYGEVPPNIDTRLIVDLRWFGLSRPRQENRVEFSERYTKGKTTKFHNVDSFDMPQPTFHFQLSKEERRTAGEMMADMVKVASYLGGFMPGSEPQFLTPGLPLHIGGTTRMGPDSADDNKAKVEKERPNVVNSTSRVCGVKNLWLGGNGLHPFGNASNPTHTSMAMAHLAVGHVASALNWTK